MAEGGHSSSESEADFEIFNGDEWEEEDDDEGEEVEEAEGIAVRPRGMEGYQFEPEFTEQELQDRAAAAAAPPEDDHMDRMQNTEW